MGGGGGRRGRTHPAQLARFPDSFSVLLDEVYTGIAEEHHSLLRYASPALRRVIFFACSASKGLGGAPGARAGFVACADPDLMAQLAKIQMYGAGGGGGDRGWDG